MPDIRGVLLPVYFLADESRSMTNYVGELNDGLASLHEALLEQPMAAAKVRISVIGFSTGTTERLHLADLRDVRELPKVEALEWTNYEAAFEHLLHCIPRDVAELKAQRYQVHRPAVFFLSDGQPNRGGDWKAARARLLDRSITPAAPNIIACGIGAEISAAAMLEVATRPDFAFVSIKGSDVGASIARFFTALTSSVVASARAVGTAAPELVVQRPEGFTMAIDVI
jgi:uncharacterized protein YegL